MSLDCRIVHDVLAMPLIPIVQEVGYRGLPIDTSKRDDMLFDIQLRSGSLAGELRAAGIDAYKSSKALGFQLKELGVPLTVTTEGGQLKTDLEIIGRLNWDLNTKREREGQARVRTHLAGVDPVAGKGGDRLRCGSRSSPSPSIRPRPSAGPKPPVR